jgi:hypothetical protein
MLNEKCGEAEPGRLSFSIWHLPFTIAVVPPARPVEA